MNVLVAGGAGYIGSHTVKRLKESGHNPIIYDNLSRGHELAVKILKVPSVFADLNNRDTLLATLRDHRIDTVVGRQPMRFPDAARLALQARAARLRSAWEGHAAP